MVAVEVGVGEAVAVAVAVGVAPPGSSSAPISGAAPFGRGSPSLSSNTPTLAPMSTIGETKLMCRSVQELKRGSTFLLALSLVPAALNVLLYARKLVAGVTLE